MKMKMAGKKSYWRREVCVTLVVLFLFSWPNYDAAAEFLDVGICWSTLPYRDVVSHVLAGCHVMLVTKVVCKCGSAVIMTTKHFPSVDVCGEMYTAQHVNTVRDQWKMIDMRWGTVSLLIDISSRFWLLTVLIVLSQLCPRLNQCLSRVLQCYYVHATYGMWPCCLCCNVM